MEINIEADLHIHTIASGHGYSTVMEIVHSAAEKGLKAIAITDHGPAMPGGPHRYYFGNLNALPEKEENVEILRGVEANIMDKDGELDLPGEYLQELDIVWAGLHTPCLIPGSRSANTEALLNALENPYVDGVVHPGNPDFPIEEEIVVKKAMEKRKLLEINNSSFVVRRGSKTRCLEIAKLIHRYEGFVALNSDAHISFDVGKEETAIQVALEAGIFPEQIVNTDVALIKSFLKKRGKKRFLKDD